MSMEDEPILGGSLIGQSHHYLDGKQVKCGGPHECIYCGITSMVQYSQRFILGGVLTIIDAVLTDKAQNKATKDLIKNKLFNEMISLEGQLGDAVYRCRAKTAKLN